ncbi:hypothetical protein ASPZODRAFT_166606 [Penicilliopsis zonata CBS 506.65]|uniref:RRM domain-containing protein n=1 Tax=Penicilliopsis zonata CBS 506.65 TaxID=1073090 RepID=A0A1L9SGN3_9EURO|nr:hypothetical protein ASPZODRAFT_166606 [Penicilliopsis zonata CBS 506.65]OJJ46332.1 hypothetical protein ASPZODRAFT_166606 [Penicilliopsis zonata CBS 506.65]
MATPADMKPRSSSRTPSAELQSGPRNGDHGGSWTRSMTPPNRMSSRSRSRESHLRRGRSSSRTPSPANNPKSAKVVVEKLTKNVTEAHLHEIFGSFGDIQSLELPMNRAFITNRGTAYVLYYDPADAEAAIAHMHEAQLDGAVLNVSIVLPRRNFSHSPPRSRYPRGSDKRQSYGPTTASGGHPSRRSPSPRRSPPHRRHGARTSDRHDLYRPQFQSRSRSSRRSTSYSSRYPSRSASPRRENRRTSDSQVDAPRRTRRRSPSYSSYSSRSDRSLSRSRSRSRSLNRHGNRRR